MATVKRTSGTASKPARVQPSPAAGADGHSLGTRLREARVNAGLSLRETARRLSVSPSFISQLETGKSQPSVATLFSLTRLLGVSIDELFVGADADGTSVDGAHHVPLAEPAPRLRLPPVPADTGATATADEVSRSQLGSPSDAWEATSPRGRIEIGTPGQRRVLTMDSGVIWEQLVVGTGSDFEFMDVVYEPHSCSTNDGRLVRHSGFEYGYLLQGELEITVGFEVYTLRAGQSFAFDSGTPHLFRNTGDTRARFVSCIRHSSD